jgi:hypothetical protein
MIDIGALIKKRQAAHDDEAWRMYFFESAALSTALKKNVSIER